MRLLPIRCWGILALAAALAVSGYAQQTASANADAAAEAKPAAKSVAGDIVLGPGDTIQIVSLKSEEISKEWRVGESGSLHLPLVGPIEVAGKSVAALEVELNEAYSVYIIDPAIDVFVAAVRSRPVTVVGAVNEPGTHQLQGPTTVFQIVQQAGGVAENADRIVIIRDTQWGVEGLPRAKLLPDGKVEAALSLEGVLQGHGPEAETPVRPFDVINVDPKRERLIHIAGEVNQPGAIVLESVDGVLLSKALVLAGGYKSSAAFKHTYLWRGSDPAQAGSFELNVRDIIQGKAEDIVLREGDYLIIPPKGGILNNMQGLSTLMPMANAALIVLSRI